jgi:threonine dehydratase
MADVVHNDTIADGLAGGGDDDAVTTEIIAEHGISIVLVPEVNIRSAVREAAESNGVVMEGSASAAYAAITENLVDDPDSRLGFVVSGRNIAHDLFAKILNETTL